MRKDPGRRTLWSRSPTFTVSFPHRHLARTVTVKPTRSSRRFRGTPYRLARFPALLLLALAISGTISPGRAQSAETDTAWTVEECVARGLEQNPRLRAARHSSERARAALRTVEVGRQSGLYGQVLSGLEAGDRVIAHPGDEVEDGARVEEFPG